MSALIVILIVAAVLVLSAFFAGYETGFVSSNPIRVRHLAEKDGNPAARRLMAQQNSPGRLITTLLVGNNLVLVIGTITLTAALGGTLATIVATPLFLIFGEVLPKSIFRVHATRLALGLMPVMRVFDVLLAPLAVPLNWVSQGLLRLFGGENRDVSTLFTSLEEMRVLVDESTDRGSIDAEEQEMIHSVMDLQTRSAKEIMVPRVRMEALPDTTPRAELVALLKESGLSRIPIYSESIDRVVGLIRAFDVLTDRNPGNPNIKRFLRPVLHVPDSLKLDDLLKRMKRERQAIAIVTDEFGGTDGIISLEDILEEIFGEIHDEYDVREPQFRRIGPNVYVIDGKLPLGDCAEALGMPLEDDEVETVGGWICHLAGRIPVRGEMILHDPFQVTILDGTRTHVSTIRLEVLRRETEVRRVGEVPQSGA
jgi:CBS domain containing-hemolysin-like protein